MIKVFGSWSSAPQGKHICQPISLQQVWESRRSHYNTSHNDTMIFEPCKQKLLTFYLFIFPSHFTRATSDSSTVRLSQSSELWTGCHCNHFLHKHTSHCWLPRWDASRDIWTLNIGRRRVGVRQRQFKTTSHHHHQPGNEPAGWFLFPGLSVAEQWWAADTKLRLVPFTLSLIIRHYATLLYFFKTTCSSVLVTFA